MAIFRTDAVTFNTTAGNKTVAITPAVGEIIIAFAANSGTTTDPTVTDDQGGTYTRVAGCIKNASADEMHFYVRNTPCQTTAVHTLTENVGGAGTGGGIWAACVPGMAKSGLNAVRQFATQDNQAGSTVPTGTFTRAPLTENMLVFAVFNTTNGAGITEPSGFTERRDVGYTTTANGLEVATRDSGHTSVTVAAQNQSPSAFGMIVVELDTATPTAGGSGRSWRPGQPHETIRRRLPFRTDAPAVVSLTASIGITSETDEAFPISKIKYKAVGLNSETDTAQAITRVKYYAIGQASETDSVTSITKIKYKSVGLTTETDSAQGITDVGADIYLLGQPSETDTAQAVTKIKYYAIGQASETDSAQAITEVGADIYAIGQASETDTAQAITRLKYVSVDQTEETDTSQAITKIKYYAIGQVSETDSAQPISETGADIYAIGQASETDSAQSVQEVHVYPIGQASETDTAQSVTIDKIVHIGQTSETDSSGDIASVHAYSIGQTSETDSAQSITEAGADVYAINQASETDEAQEISSIKYYAIGQVEETDEAQEIIESEAGVFVIGQTDEIDEAQGISRQKIVHIGQASETDSSLHISHSNNIGQTNETDAAQEITSVHIYTIGQAQEGGTVEVPVPVPVPDPQPGTGGVGPSPYPATTPLMASMARKIVQIGVATETDAVGYVLPVNVVKKSKRKLFKSSRKPTKVVQIGMATEVSHYGSVSINLIDNTQPMTLEDDLITSENESVASIRRRIEEDLLVLSDLI